MLENLPDIAPPESATQRYVAQRYMDERKFNPFDKLIDLAEQLEEEAAQPPTEDNPNPHRHLKERISILSKLAAYYAPAPKAIDINYTSDQKFTIQAVDFSSLAEERKNLIPAAGNYQGPALTLLANAKEVGDPS